MRLFAVISKRKSTRQFNNIPLDNHQLDELLEKIKGFELLDADSPLTFRIAKETKGPFNIEAPHYLIITGHGKIHEKANAGYVGQRFVLWLHTLGIATVWLGKSKDTGPTYNKNDLIIIAFGTTDYSIERDLAEFKRKSIDTITNIPLDECIKAVHLAPSGMNLQPWYFEKRANKIIVYQQILKPPVSLLYQSVEVDMGIALSHYQIACEHLQKPFSFKFINGKSDKKGYQLFGEIVY